MRSLAHPLALCPVSGSMAGPGRLWVVTAHCAVGLWQRLILRVTGVVSSAFEMY